MDVSRNGPRAFVAAAVLVILLLLGTMVPGVLGSSDIPSHSWPGYPQVDVEFEAIIVARKFIDADGTLNTEADQTSADWKFVLETDATITDAGDNRWAVRYGSRGASVTITEVAKKGFEPLGAFCVEPTSGYSVGALDGGTLTVALQVVVERAEYVCEFVNTGSAVERDTGGTGTAPNNTLPPTDSGGAASTLAADGWRHMVVVLAGVLAASLVSIGDLRRRWAHPARIVSAGEGAASLSRRR